MLFILFAVLAFIVLRLTFRGRLRTFILFAIIFGLLADFALDLIVSLRR